MIFNETDLYKWIYVEENIFLGVRINFSDVRGTGTVDDSSGDGNHRHYCNETDLVMVMKHPRNNFLFSVNSFLEICFQKYFGRVITNAATLDPVIFVVPKLMSSGGIICGIIFSYCMF